MGMGEARLSARSSKGIVGSTPKTMPTQVLRSSCLARTFVAQIVATWSRAVRSVLGWLSTATRLCRKFTRTRWVAGNPERKAAIASLEAARELAFFPTGRKMMVAAHPIGRRSSTTWGPSERGSVQFARRPEWLKEIRRCCCQGGIPRRCGRRRARSGIRLPFLCSKPRRQ